VVILFVQFVGGLRVEGAKAQFLKVKQTERIEGGAVMVDGSFTARDETP
jgi:hypothetical protein